MTPRLTFASTLAIFITAALVGAAPAAAKPVGPQTSTIVFVINDASPGPLDMRGEITGRASYRQAADGSPTWTWNFFATPNTTYTIYLACGPSHATACGFMPVGQIQTRSNGRAVGTTTVAAATIRTSFGCGYRTDHFDIEASGSPVVSVAGAINYYIPCTSSGASAKTSSSGDPLGATGPEAAASVHTQTVGPQTFTRVRVVHDCNAPGNEREPLPCDMDGPDAGNLRYSQHSDGSLEFSVDGGTAYLVCGPSHALACGWFRAWRSGGGSGPFVVPAATIRATFGCGYRTDHIDVPGNVAGAINYYIPCN